MMGIPERQGPPGLYHPAMSPLLQRPERRLRLAQPSWTKQEHWLNSSVGGAAGAKELNHEPHEHSRTVLYADEVFRIQGAVYDVNRGMRPGFLEAVYQECLMLEFASRAIPFRAMPQLPLSYKGARLKQVYVPDFVCFDCIIVELKAVREIAPEHRAQVINYLRATSLRLGLLINFGPTRSKAQIERLVV